MKREKTLMKKLTLTRALNEVKITEKKIAQINEKAKGWTILTKNGKIVSSRFENLEQFNSHVKSNKDKVTSLIAYRNTVKRALLAANNTTVVSIDGVDMTIAEAIDRKAFADKVSQRLYEMKKEENRIHDDADVVSEKLSTMRLTRGRRMNGATGEGAVVGGDVGSNVSLRRQATGASAKALCGV